jgi:Nif-specific regulatory protein
VIVATNTDLQELVRQKAFREDLFYRLQILRVRIPSLRERPEDVLPMAREFLRTACEKHELGELELSPATESALEVANWPGNIRQLAHAIEAAAVNAAAGLSRVVRPDHVFPSAEGPGTIANGDELESLQRQLHAVRGRIVQSALRRTGWNVSETARRLDIARSYLYKLVEAHDIRRED